MSRQSNKRFSLGLRACLAAVAALAATVVFAGSAQATVFTNNTPTTIPTLGNASPYPSTINVSGQGALLADVKVTLTGLSHTWPDDLDVLLVSPAGTGSILTSDNCGSTDLVSASLTFSAYGGSTLSDNGACASGTYRPSDVTDAPADNWGVSGAPFTANLINFWGENPNGAWKLYIVDDSSGDSGSLASWSLDITTASILTSTNGQAASGQANPYPYVKNVSGLSGPVTDVNARLVGLTHTFPDDLDILVQSPSGHTALIMSDACGTGDLSNAILSFDDQAATTLSDAGPCTPGAYIPSNYEATVDTFPSPAPPGPYGTSLAVFNGESANGDWKFYVNDDTGSDRGWINSADLEIATQPPAVQQQAAAPVFKTVKKCKKVKVKKHGKVVKKKNGKIKYKKKCTKKKVQV